MFTTPRSQFISSKLLRSLLVALLATIGFGLVQSAAAYSEVRREAEDSCNETYNTFIAYNATASEDLEIGFESPINQARVIFPISVNTG